MAEPLTRPIQVFLDTKQLIQIQRTGTRGPNRDFFEDNDAGFRRHKERILKSLNQARTALQERDDPAGFILVQMRQEGLGKSYRPLGALFTNSHGFALVGGGAIGQMYFQATPEALDELITLIEKKAEVTPKIIQNTKTGESEKRVSPYRSELGAIDDIRMPAPSDRLNFSAEEGVSWLGKENVIGGYVVELFQPEPRVAPEAVYAMLRRFESRLRHLGGVHAIPFGARRGRATSTALTVDLGSTSRDRIELPFQETALLQQSTEKKLPAHLDRSVSRHQALLDILSTEPLVRRIELPLRLEATPANSTGLATAADIPGPIHGQSYPVAGIIDAGVCSVPQLALWCAGSAGLIPPADRDEEHGSFIAGLLIAAGGLNPDLASRFERVPCRFYDLDILPGRGLLSRYYHTPEEFFDQLESQIAAAKSQTGARIFNMSLGAPNVRQGLGYSSFAAQLDRIAKDQDVIFVVSAGNLRGISARPEWLKEADATLAMLATRAMAEERITAPGEHLYGITVGALNPPGAVGTLADVPTAYTRRGPGPGGARKPELAQIGGALPRGGNRSGLFSIGPDGKLADGCGTSYAAPLVTATLAVLNHRLHGTAQRETLMALPVHNARRPEPMLHRALRSIARDFIGFGVTCDADTCLSDRPHSITLVFEDVLPPRRELGFVFTWPRSLTNADGKCRGHVDITLAYTPPIDPAFDSECQRVQLEAVLHQLEEKELDDGSIEMNPQSRLKHSDTDLAQNLDYSERYMLENGLKWTPLKRYERNMPRGIGTRSDWRLGLKGLTRAGAVYPNDGVPFSIIMTISDPRGEAPIYEEVRNEILRRGLRLADITVAQRIRASGRT
jgi:hypothetical protein